MIIICISIFILQNVTIVKCFPLFNLFNNSNNNVIIILKSY